MKLALFVLILVIVLAAFVVLPTIDIDVDAVVSSNAFTYIRAGLYFIPTDTVVTIGTLILALWVFRIIIAFVKVLWDVLPVA